MNFNWVIPILILTSSIVLILWTTRFNNKISFGQESSWAKYITGSALYGLSAFLIFVGITLVMGLIDKDYVWSTHEIIGAVIFGLFCGIVAMIGSLWQFLIVGKFRELLYKNLKSKNKNK